jgi:hypothetical protein
LSGGAPAALLARVKLRALCLTLLASACFAPGANAAVADSLLPIYDAADDVHVRGGGESLRFGPKAAKLYKTFAGKRASVGCAEVYDDDGALRSSGFMSHPDYRIAKRRGSVPMWTAGDYCAIATKRTKQEARCFPAEAGSLCVRVIVATNAKGRAFLDQRSRTIELSMTISAVGLAGDPTSKLPGGTRLERVQAMLGPDVVELATPEDSPPAGKVGFWTDDRTGIAAVALLADGTRRYVRFQDGVYSTNDLLLNGLDNAEVFTLL